MNPIPAPKDFDEAFRGEHAGSAFRAALDAAREAPPIPTTTEIEAARAREGVVAALNENRLGVLAGPAFARMRLRRDGEEQPVPLPEKWSRTSKELHGGLWSGAYVLVGGTGVGKSQWCFQVAYNAALRGVPVAYVGLELDRLGLVARCAALGLRYRNIGGDGGGRAPVSWRDLYYGSESALRWFEHERAPGRRVLDELDRAPLYLLTGEAMGWPYAKITELAHQMRAAHPVGPALMVVDFLQLVAGVDFKQDIRERIGAAAYLAREAAKNLNLTVLLLSATPRSAYKLFKGQDKDDPSPLGTGDPGRFVGAGKESGEIEFSADGTLALCRGPWEPGASPPVCWLAVSKLRTGRAEGGKGWVPYSFDGTVFEETDATPAQEKSNRRGRDDD